MTLQGTQDAVVEPTVRSSRRPGPSRRVAAWILVALSAQFLIFGLIEAWRDAPTFDEGFYVSGGVTALTRHQLRLTPEHGIIPKVMAGLPALAARPAIPNGQSWRQGDQNNYYFDFIRAQSQKGTLRSVFFLARLPFLAVAIALGWALYALGTMLFGRVAGLVAAVAWLTTSYALAFAHIVGSDLPFALAVVLTGLALLRWADRQTTGRLVVLGLGCLAVLLTRYSGLALVPVFAFAVFMLAENARPWRRLSLAGAVLAMSWAGVWVVTRAISPFPKYRSARVFASALPDTGLTRVARLIPWPHEYAQGILRTGNLAHASTATFLFGRHGNGARWLYWPGALLVKLPAGALVLVASGLLFWLAVPKSGRLRTVLAVVLPLVVLISGTVTYSRPSLRYFLPGIALLMLLGSAAFARTLQLNAGRVAIGVLAVVQVLMLWSAVPHSLAWTAPPFQPGYRFIGDTSDWGQDFYRLQHWAAGKRALVGYFGPPLFPSDARSLFGTDPQEIRGWVAVSTAYFTYQSLTVPDEVSWLRAYCPVGTIGGSILVYRFQDPPNTAKGPKVAARPCRGPYSRRTASARAHGTPVRRSD